MTKQLYYDDVEVGTEITPLAKIATTAMLVRWAGASGNFDPLHYDDVYAQSRRLERPIIHGALERAWLVQMLTDWIGDDGFIKKVACYYIRMDYPRRMKSMTEPDDGDTWWCRGKVTKKYERENRHYVECQIWVENGKGERITPGSATVILPLKAG